MVSLNLTVGRWNLSLDFGKAEEESVQVIALRDLTEIAAAEDPDAEAGFGFTPTIVGQPKGRAHGVE